VSSPNEKRNVLLLFGTQSLFQTASVMVATIAGLIGMKLAPDKSLATFPIAMMMVAAAAMMIPASMFMQRFGRKAGFFLGAGFGATAGLTAAAALWLGSFALFVLAQMLVGCYQGFAQYYRFAAADASSAAFKSRAIAWVIGGGVVAAVAGPNLALLTQGVGPVPFAASYLSLVLLSLLAVLLMSRLDLPPMNATETHAPGRPLLDIILQPRFLTALISSAVAYAAMTTVMTATPLAMQVCGLSLGASAMVIQWHVLGMFIPSFFTGNLIRRFGVLQIMGTGTVLLSLHVAIALSGSSYAHFLSGLIILGLGWNFLFIGGTTLLTESYRPSERAKAQAANDFLAFVTVSIASFSSGGLLNAFGWRAVNIAVTPFIALAMLMIIGQALARCEGAPAMSEHI